MYPTGLTSSNLKSLFLMPTSLAMPVFVAPEEIELGRSVFHNFVQQEFEHEGLSDEVLLEEDNSVEQNGFVDENFAIAHREVFHGRSNALDLAGTPEGYKSIAISQVGTAIRELANEFAQSRQREAIHHEADEVNLSALNFDRFWGLLDEVFRHGITSHNLIALFFFCSDVMIRCVRLKLRELGMNLFQWSLRYIADRVCKWVHENGGWERVLRKAFVHTKVVAAVAIVMLAAGGWFLFKGIKK